MAKQTKATRKFEKSKLKGTLERRKDFAKVKQRHQVQVKKKQKAERRAEKEEEANGKVKDASDDEIVEDMNDDAFFQEGILLPEEKPSKSKSVKLQVGKRKREEPAAEEEQVGSVLSGVSDDEDSPYSGDEEDLEAHQGQLDALAQKDPAFYKYLKENDADLLDFNEDGDLGEIDALSASDEERPSKKRKNKQTANLDEETTDKSAVTADILEKWKLSLSEQNSIRALRQVVLAFRAAAHINDDDEGEFKYSIPDPEIYHETLMLALQHVPSVLNHHLPVKESAAGKIRIPTDSPKFNTLTPLIKSHSSSLHYLLNNLSDAATLKLTLQSFEPLLPYLLQFRKFLKVITKSVAAIWSDNSSDEATRITAFLIIRRLMVIGDSGIREAVLKSTYEGVVKGSRNTTAHTLAGINLMKNSAAEIWGIDQKISYTTGFTFIRQLAVHLRTNITKPTKDSYKTVYNWQFVHSLDFWSRVLSMHCSSLVEAQNGKESQLRPLIYPIVQITMGVMRLIPTSTYFPLRFQLMRSLLRISRSTGTYIPLSSALLEVLSSAEMKKAPKPTTLRPLEFDLNIRAPTSYLRTRAYQDGVGEQVVELFSEFFVLWSKSIAFPELQLPVSVMLKRWLRTASSKSTGNKNSKVNQSILLLIQKLDTNTRWLEERRNKVTFAPKDRAEVESFLKDVDWEQTPFGAFVVTQRKMRDDRNKVLDQGKREEDRKRREREAGSDDDDETNV